MGGRAPICKTCSPRELEIAPLLADRYADKEIAERLHSGVGTVRTHLDRMRVKSGLHDRRALGTWALQQAEPDGVYGIDTDTGPMDASIP